MVVNQYFVRGLWLGSSAHREDLILESVIQGGHTGTCFIGGQKLLAGKKPDTIDELRASLHEQAEQQKRFRAGIEARDKVLEALVAACEVPEEPISFDEAAGAVTAQGWDHVCTAKDTFSYHRGGEYLELIRSDDGRHVTRTRYCPPDLLDGRLKALEVADG